ncbi:MAG: hypothetical protein ABIO16_18530 [Nocardioides sp.]
MTARPKASPWPFVGMTGMAAAFFLYGASGLIVPVWALTALIFVWLLLFVQACRWWTPHPKRLLVLPLVAVVVLFALVAAGASWLGWQA